MILAWMRKALSGLSLFSGDHWQPTSGYVAGLKTSSGETVTPESAMVLSAYFACLRNLSEDVAKLEICLYQYQGGRKREIENSAIERLLNIAPNAEMSAMQMRETLQHWAMGWGRGCAEIERDGVGNPLALWPIHPSRVICKRDPGGRLFYEVANNNNTKIRIDPFNIFDLKGLGDGMNGYSVARLAAESIGVGIAAQTFGAAYFGNGTTVGGVLEHPGRMNVEAHKQLRASWQEIHQGAERAHKVAILEEGMKFSKTSIPPDEAQFIETRQFCVEDIARWFRMPPHKIGHLLRATFSNIEHQGLEYVGDTCSPWLRRWEQEIKRKLIADRDVDLYAEHDTDDLELRDYAARQSFYTALFQMGVLSPNEIRGREGLNPVGAEGDAHFVQLNLTTLTKAAAEPDPIEPEPPEPVKPIEPEPTPEPVEVEEIEPNARLEKSFRAVFMDAAQRVIRKEAMAVARMQKKHAGNRAAFADELGKFLAEHQDYIHDVFEPAVDSFSAAIGADFTDASLALIALAQWRVIISRETALAAFDAGVVHISQERPAAALVAGRVMAKILEVKNAQSKVLA